MYHAKTSQPIREQKFAYPYRHEKKRADGQISILID